MADHLINSAHVTDFNCDSLFADTITELPILVVNIHNMSHPTSADLPIPRPLLTAIRSVSKSILP
jgi:hypothetical protein